MWDTGVRVLARAMPIALGLVLLGAAAHVNIQYMGGYNSPQAIMLLAAIVALGGGAVLVGRAFAQVLEFVELLFDLVCPAQLPAPVLQLLGQIVQLQ